MKVYDLVSRLDDCVSVYLRNSLDLHSATWYIYLGTLHCNNYSEKNLDFLVEALSHWISLQLVLLCSQYWDTWIFFKTISILIHTLYLHKNVFFSGELESLFLNLRLISKFILETIVNCQSVARFRQGVNWYETWPSIWSHRNSGARLNFAKVMTHLEGSYMS